MSVILIFTWGVIFGVLFDFILGFILNSLHIKTILFGFRIHHSVLGLISIITGIFIYPSYLISFGIGIILGHTIRNKKIEFIEKTNKMLKRR